MVPALHAEQVEAEEAPSSVPTFPAEQAVHDEAPDSSAYRPLEHAWHPLLMSDDLYCPASQDVHVVLPASAHWPAGQGSQVSSEVAPTVEERVPFGQLLQLVEAKLSLYVPAPHC